MKNYLFYSFAFLLLLLTPWVGQAQDKTAWSLQEMIDYATANNIQVKQALLSSQSSQADYQQAQAGRLPTLNATGQQTLTAGRSVDPVTSDFVAQDIHATSLSLNSQLTLFNGNKVNNYIKQSKLLVQSGRLEVEEAKNSIAVALTQAYLQTLYNQEAVGIAQSTVNASGKQVERMQALLDAGSATAGELAQVKAQLAADKASLITAQHAYDAQVLTLKQLLELELEDDFAIDVPAQDTVRPVTVSKSEAYQNALAHLPQVNNSRLGIDVAQLNYARAKADYLPTVSLAASVGTGYTSAQEYLYLDQLDNNRNERVGLTVSIPIFNQKKTATSVQKAKIGIESAKLEARATQKEVLQTVENTYQQAVAGQSQLEAAREQLIAAEESYRLAEQQFGLGMLNTADYLLQQINYHSAWQSYLQAKYTALLYYQLLEFYQGNPIQL